MTKLLWLKTELSLEKLAAACAIELVTFLLNPTVVSDNTTLGTINQVVHTFSTGGCLWEPLFALGGKRTTVRLQSTVVPPEGSACASRSNVWF